jgi:hypothetical protein
MTNFRITRQELTIVFAVQTTDEVVTYRGTTSFTPNYCRVRAEDGKIISISLDKLDENGWGIDDPAGPDGAQLNASFGGGELMPSYLPKLPKIVRNVLTEVQKVAHIHP